MAQAGSNRPNQQQQARVRSLRIGVILGGKIIEEKLIRKREQITIGQSAKNTFSVPVEGMPRSWPLFVVKDNQYYLYFSDAMDGRVSDGGSVQPLSALRGSGAQRYNEGWVMPLPDSSRGKVVLGDMTLLFQFVSAPPLQPRPHLPASVRGTLADRVDPQLAIITALSIMIHLGVMIYARGCHDPPKSRVDVIYESTFPEEFETFDEPKAVEVEVEGEGEGEDKPEEKPEDKADKPDKPADRNEDKGDTSDEQPKGMTEEEMDRSADAMMEDMFGEESEDGTARGKSMDDLNLNTDLEDATDKVEKGNQTVADLNKNVDRGPKGTDRRRGTTEGPDVDKPTERGDTGTGGGPKVPKKPDVKPKDLSSDEQTTLTPSSILTKIRRQYSHGLKNCFKKVLKIDESASGTVRLKFQIGERGNVTRAKADGFGYDTLDRCVESQAMGWRFSPPKDDAGDPTTMTVKLALPFTGR